MFHLRNEFNNFSFDRRIQEKKLTGEHYKCAYHIIKHFANHDDNKQKNYRKTFKIYKLHVHDINLDRAGLVTYKYTNSVSFAI